MLRWRLLTGTSLISLVVALVLWGPTVLVQAVILAVGLLATWEMCGLYRGGGIRVHRGVVLLANGGLLALTAWCSEAAALPLWLAGATMAVLLAQLTRADDPQPLASIGASLHILLYLGVLLSFLPRLVRLGEPDGRYLGVWLLLVVKACDTGAYFTGRAIGKHKLIPRLSPGKTWEGCAGGVVAAVLAGLAMWYVQGGELDGIEVPLAFALVVPMLLAVLGIGGDLMESQLKRSLQVKDSGELLRGMGGILDVIDSLLPTAPMLYFCLYLLLEWLL